MAATPEQHNNIKWSGFFLTEEAAQKAFEAVLAQESKDFRIVSAKKELLKKKKDAYYLFKFTIIKASLDK
jgi:hypothetical protein